MRKNYAILTMLAAMAQSAGADLRLTQTNSRRTPSDRDQRTPEDLSARQQERQAKLARRAKRHAAKAAKDVKDE